MTYQRDELAILQQQKNSKAPNFLVFFGCIMNFVCCPLRFAQKHQVFSDKYEYVQYDLHATLVICEAVFGTVPLQLMRKVNFGRFLVEDNRYKEIKK